LKASVEEVKSCHSFFDLIITNESGLLDLPNAQFCLFGGKWIDSMPVCKRYEVSFLYSRGIGHEQYFKGYSDRKEVWNLQERIRMDRKFYTSVMRPPDVRPLVPFHGQEKSSLFESMFSIVIENDYQENYFSVKLIDAMYGYSVPVYMGAPNIGDFFDLQGLILPVSPSDLVDMLNSLTIDDYYSRLDSLCRNRRCSARFWDVTHRIRSRIENAYRMKCL
jgi:hypothetical protein